MMLKICKRFKNLYLLLGNSVKLLHYKR